MVIETKDAGTLFRALSSELATMTGSKFSPLLYMILSDPKELYLPLNKAHKPSLAEKRHGSPLTKAERKWLKVAKRQPQCN